MSQRLYLPGYPTPATGVAVQPGFAAGGFGGGGGGGLANPIDSADMGLFTFSNPTTPETSSDYDEYHNSNWNNGTPPTRSGYNPNTIADRVVESYYVTASLEQFRGFTYKPWNTAGLQFDPASGLRIQMLTCLNDPWNVQPMISIHGYGAGPEAGPGIDFRAGVNQGSPNDKFRVFEWDGLTTKTITEYPYSSDPSANADCWMLFSVEMPKGFTGSAVMTHEQLGTNTWYRSQAHPLAGDYSTGAMTLDAISIAQWSRSNAGGYEDTVVHSFWWCGTADDAWQITPSS